MGHAKVPAFIEGGGALTPGSVLRAMLNAVTDGLEGVVLPGDCTVKALSTPGTSVRALPGIYSIRSKAQGADRQNYYGLIETEDTVSVPTNNTSSTRYDLVVIRVEDPYAESGIWTPPVDTVNGPYVYTRIISGVSSTAVKLSQLSSPYNTQSAIVLARIAIPPSTGTITDDMITNLATPIMYGERNVDGLAETRVISEDKYIENTTPLGSTSFADVPGASWQVAIPKWGSGFNCINVGTDMKVASIHNFFGEIRLMIGSSTGTPNIVDDDRTASGSDTDPKRRFWAAVRGTYSIPAALRGTTQTFKLQYRNLPAGAGYPNRGTPTLNKVYASLSGVFQAEPDYT